MRSHAFLIALIFLGATTAFSLSELIKITSNIDNNVTQENLASAPPFPILRIAAEHVFAQLGSNATKAENATLFKSSKFVMLKNLNGPVQCSPTSPCVDASCCNSEGKCGYTTYTCKNTAATTCISNCDATAMCGVNSLDAAQKCPLEICCSYFGYCGTSSVFCQAADAAGTDTTPCQQGYGNCQVIPPPQCDSSLTLASNGRKVAYYQAANVRYRGCNRIQASQIDTDGLTHLIFTFASIDPGTFNVVPSDRGDRVLYEQFVALKTPQMQTWISIGGGDFSNPGTPTLTTWSDMVGSVENRAAFIASLVSFMDTWGFQGVDLDWEYPTIAVKGGKPGDTANLCNLLSEMRTSFGTRYGISIVIPTDYVYLAGYDPKGLQPYVDFFNYMAYDLHGPWEAQYLGASIRAQTSIADISSTMVPLWFDGVDPKKINLGLAYYGRGYTLTDPSCQSLGCAYSGPSRPGTCTGSAGLLSLQEIETIIREKNLAPQLLSDLMIKQIVYDGNQWMGYDDSETIQLKTRWADGNCLGGTVIWSIDFNSGPGSGDHPPVISTDGACGNGVTCTGSPFGECCSMYGWCGSGSDWCSAGSCQFAFGTCPVPAAPGATISQNGQCGLDVTCQGSAFGNCCSAAGWCGSTAEYCS